MTNLTELSNWVDTEEYPFRNQYIWLRSGLMHYVDEGEGDVLLFVHGMPTWSFLYRHLIAHFKDAYRCIAVDHIGFGLSEKPEGFRGTPPDHAANLAEFIERMDLDGITLVVHDFGGPIGLAAALDNPRKIKRIIAFNTWLSETRFEPAAQKADRILKGRLGEALYLRWNVSPRWLLPLGFKRRRTLSRAVHRHYLQPFPDRASRGSLLALGRSLMGCSEWFDKQGRRLKRLEHLPWLILWGTGDPYISRRQLATWKGRLPSAEVVEMDSGHFVPEEQPDHAIKEIEQFLKNHL